jgi:hypothetical protein
MCATKTQKPKTFSLYWGTGVIAEEAQISTEHHRPTIQLLEFTDGPAKGAREIRFCFYDHNGRFQRSPLIIDEDDIPALREALNATPKLKRLLARLCGH